MALAWLPAKRSLDTQASHELRQALAGDAELVGRAAAMASRLHQRGADEGVFKGSSSCPEAQGRGLRDRREPRPTAPLGFLSAASGRPRSDRGGARCLRGAREAGAPGSEPHLGDKANPT